MTQQPMIWALDLARVTGWAAGRAGGTPKATVVRLGPDGCSDDFLFVSCLRWFTGALERGPLPDVLSIEALLPPIARRGHTSTGAQHRLAGLHGIVRALACHMRVPEVISANVLDVRQHFIQRRDLKRAAAKRAVMDTCELLGWRANDTNCGDALALWSYTAGIIDPRTALQVTPLFATWDEVAKHRQAKQG